MDFCTDMQIDHTLDNPDVPVIEVLQVFGVRRRDGDFSSQASVRADTVAAAWRAVAEVHLLEGRPDPRKPPGSSSRDLDKRLTRMLRHWGYQDPPTKREKAIPLGFVMFAVARATLDAFTQCWTDLIVIALFFCLRSCEYTKTNSHRRTTQFRMRDMQFQDAEGVIPWNAPDAQFLAALAMTLFLDTQKNCVRGESCTHEATGLLHGDAVTAGARRFLHLRSHNAPPDTPICVYYEAPGAAQKSVTGSHIVKHLRETARAIGFKKLGFYAHEIGSHSLRSGGAMTLHQAHVADSTIKIIGRWKSDAFLIYLQGQVATFTKGVAKAMAAVQWFTHQVPVPCSA